MKLNIPGIGIPANVWQYLKRPDIQYTAEKRETVPSCVPGHCVSA